MKIRSYELKDEHAVISLWQECGLVVPWNDPKKDIERKLKVDADLFLVGELKDEIIASVMIGYEGHRGWVNYLAVSPNQQGNGFAKSLMIQAESLLLNLNCPKLNLQIRQTNLHAIGFYESLGYKKDAAVSMGKRLIADD